MFDAPWSTLQTVNNALVVIDPTFAIHGSIHIPPSKGYELAYVSGDAEFEDDFAPQMPARSSTWSWGISSINNTISSIISPPAAPTTISSDYNIVASLIALAQAIDNSVTLYQARGNQIDQYGCAAFGLTVAPFLLMSIINLLGNISAPIYSTIYMIETSVMVEARRHGCCFDGVVGRLREGRGAELFSAVDKVTWVESATFENGETNHLTVDIVRSPNTNPQTLPTQIAVEEQDNKETSVAAEKRLTVDKQKKVCQRYIMKVSIENENPQYMIAIPSCPIIGSPDGKNQLRPRNRGFSFYFGRMLGRILMPRETYSILRQRRSIWRDMPTAEDPNPGLSHLGPPDRFTITTNKIGSELTIACDQNNYTPSTNLVWLWGCFLGLIPLAIVGGLSKFKVGHSTAAQRGWTMSWLGAGYLAGVIVSGVGVPTDKKSIKSQTAMNGTVFFLIFFGAVAIGGFVVVGQMVKEYGTCISLP